ncbi:MAG: nuclear transport factor 2 family protein [Acidimicrobiales bacterium]
MSEGVRNALAAYAHALDDGRTDDVVATFCEDGAIDMGDLGVHEGHAGLRAAYGRWVPRMPQRHLVLNTNITAWDEREATAVSDVVLLLRIDGSWQVQLVGRYRDVLHEDGGAWRFHHRTAEFVSEG